MKTILAVLGYVVIGIFVGSLIVGVIFFDEIASLVGYYRPLEKNSIAIVSGYGSQESYGDSIVGRKVIVRDDISANENGWFRREIYPISSLSDLGIDAKFQADFPVEYERDWSASNKAYVPYFTMNVSPTVDILRLQAFLKNNPEVIATTVVIRLDGENREQECSLEGLQVGAVRFVLYSGEGVTYQVCNPDWTAPK